MSCDRRMFLKASLAAAGLGSGVPTPSGIVTPRTGIGAREETGCVEDTAATGAGAAGAGAADAGGSGRDEGVCGAPSAPALNASASSGAD